MILISSEEAKAVDALGLEEVEYLIVPVNDKNCPRPPSRSPVRHGKKSVKKIFNRCNHQEEEYDIHLSTTIEVHFTLKYIKWIFERRNILKAFSTPQIYYLFGKGTVLYNLSEVTELMHATNAEEGCNYTCPIQYASRNRCIIQL